MLITRLKINYFGRFKDREILLKPGINLIYGDNEAGKSTLHAFVKGMLFGIEKPRGRATSRNDTYSRYLPWDYPGAYGGSMDIRIGDKDYRLFRSFHASDKSFGIIDLSNGRELKLKEGAISELIPGLTESTYKNTVSIEQLKARTDSELAAELGNYIANLSVSGSRELDVAKAISHLNKKRKELEAADYKSRLKELSEEIRACIEKEEKAERLYQVLDKLTEQEGQLSKELAAASASLNNEEAERINELPAILEKYKSYQDITGQLMQLRQRRVALQEQLELAAARTGQITEEGLEEDINKAEEIKLKEARLQAQIDELGVEKGLKKAAKGLLYTLLPFAAAGLVIMLLAAYIPGAQIISCLLLAAGLAAFSLYANRHRQSWQKGSERLEELNTELRRLRAEKDALLAKYKLSSEEELERKQKELLKCLYELRNLKEQQRNINQLENELEDKRDMLYETIMRYIQYFMHQDELSPETIERLKELIRQKRQAGSDALAALTARYNECRLQIEKLKWELTELEGNEKELMQRQELFNRLSQQQKEAELELAAVRLAIETIEELSQSIHDSFGGQLTKAVSDIVSEITGGRYNQLRIDENLDVKVYCKDEFKLLDKFSAGTIDQIYFSLRLAVADLLLANEELPLILDDSFALYDDTRLRAAISGIANRHQIILFTCHRREEAIIRELGLDFNLIKLS